MESDEPEVLDSFFTQKQLTRRRALLPWWIKAFSWLFMIFGGLAMASVLLGVLGMKVDLAFYGLETDQPLTVTGLSVIAIGMLKGAAAFSLWTEKAYAITLGQVDAFLGIVICFIVMMYPLFDGQDGFRFNFRAELLLLIPFLLKLRKIQPQWNQEDASR